MSISDFAIVKTQIDSSEIGMGKKDLTCSKISLEGRFRQLFQIVGRTICFNVIGFMVEKMNNNQVKNSVEVLGPVPRKQKLKTDLKAKVMSFSLRVPQD